MYYFIYNYDITKSFSVLCFTDVHGNGHKILEMNTGNITSVYRCADIARKKSSEMVFESIGVITDNAYLGSTCSLVLMTVFTVEPVPSFAWKSIAKEEGNCFESFELHESVIQLCTEEGTSESQREESDCLLDSGSVLGDCFSMELCLTTSEVCMGSEAGELIVASILSSSVKSNCPGIIQ